MAGTVKLDWEQFRQVLGRLDRIDARLAALAGEDPGAACARCGDESQDLVPGPDGRGLCAKCKVVVEEVPA